MFSYKISRSLWVTGKRERMREREFYFYYVRRLFLSRQHRQFSGLINSLCFSHSFEFSGTRSPFRFSCKPFLLNLIIFSSPGEYFALQAQRERLSFFNFLRNCIILLYYQSCRMMEWNALHNFQVSRSTRLQSW